jgi:hypothetical protein
MKRLIQTIAILLLGILIVISGFVYDAMFAGIPYQDPTPELQARYDFHSSVAGVFYQAGVMLFLVGLLSISIIFKKTKQTGANKAMQVIVAERGKF